MKQNVPPFVALASVNMVQCTNRDHALYVLTPFLEDEVDGFLRGERDDIQTDLAAEHPAALRLVELPCCQRIFFAGSSMAHHERDGRWRDSCGDVPELRKPIQSSWYRRQGPTSSNARQRCGKYTRNQAAANQAAKHNKQYATVVSVCRVCL